jgi:hypothetical protein
VPWEGRGSIPGWKVSHKQLGDQLLEWYRDIWVSGAGDEVPFNGCQHAVFHVKILYFL